MLCELGAWVCACASRSAGVLADAAAALVAITRACDEAARALPSAGRLDADLLGWPGLMSREKQLPNNIIRK